MDQPPATPRAFGMIHSDLHTANCMFDEQGRAGAIDFSEAAPGWRLFDAAVPLLDFDMDWETPRNDLRDAWLAGYRSVLPFPAETEDEIDTFLAARCADLANWVLDWSVETQIKRAAPFLRMISK
jgi:Ser/Thr protein kinase RdoA (MazF antagonist)